MPDCSWENRQNAVRQFSARMLATAVQRGGEHNKVTEKSGIPIRLVPAFSCPVVVTENVQVSRWRNTVNFVVTVGEFACDLRASP